MRRLSVDIRNIADLHNLASAFQKAAQGRSHQSDVREFAQNLERKLAEMGREIREGTISVGQMRSFEIRDPKRRLIHAPVFRERVLHHAFINYLGPILDRALVYDTYACRTGKGSLAAVLRAQRHLRRFTWFVKVDIRSYFHSIHHDRLLELLRRRFNGRKVMRQCERMVRAYETQSGRGLPIGALTSQHFANTYLAPLDRYLLEELKVSAMVRYMDDSVAWCSTRREARRVLNCIRSFVDEKLGLKLHPRSYIQRSSEGLGFLGFRIYPGTLHLSNRRRARFRAARSSWEGAYQHGLIDALSLQKGMASALAIVRHAEAKTFLRREFACAGDIDA